VVFDIKNNVMMNLNSKQFSGKESEDFNAHLTHFLDACSTINPVGVLESDKRLRLFGYSLTGRAKYLLDTLPSGTIETWGSTQEIVLGQVFPYYKILGAEEGNFQLQATRW